MAGKGQAYAPSMSDAAVRARTGKDWKGWFGTLDRAGAARLDHKAIARLLSGEHRLSGWWCQMVAVEYERARGLRRVHEKDGGFSVSVSKTVPVALGRLFEATTDEAIRRRWFPKGRFALSSMTKGKYLRGSWNGSARLAIGFASKGKA